MFTNNIVIKIVKEVEEKMSRYLTDDFSQYSDEDKCKFAKDVINIASYCSAGVAPLPIPIWDVFIITPIQICMVRAIGNIYGYKNEVSGDRAKEVLTTIASGYLGQQVCLGILKLLPFSGSLISPVFVWGWTKGIGTLAMEYFKNGMKRG